MNDDAITGLIRFRQQMDQEMEGGWTTLEAPAVSLLSEVCQALGLPAEDRFCILGYDGVQALASLLESRGYSTPQHNSAHAHHRDHHRNPRQEYAMTYVRKHGRICMGIYRRVFPHWSPETLRLDLAHLVETGLLVKNGRTKGTYYTLSPVESIS